MPVLAVVARLYAYRSLVLLLLLAIAGGLCYYLFLDNQKKDEEKQSILNLYATSPPAGRATDAQGRETVRVVTPVISPAVLADLKSGLAAEMRQQLRQEFGRQAQLLSAQRTATVTRQQLPTVALVDTTIRRPGPGGHVVSKPAKTGTFRDPWLSLTGVVLPGTNGHDSLQVKYTVRNEFDIRAYSKRDAKHWWMFWKPRLTYVDLKNKNPNTTTTGIEAVRVEKR